MLSAAAVRVLTWLEPCRKRAEEKRRVIRAKHMKIKVTSIHDDNNNEFDQCIAAFEENFLRGRELSSQLTCMVNGKVELQIHGSRDPSSFSDDSTAVVFSSGKVLESTALAMLVDRHKLDYSDPIAKHWPEFGKAFSSETTVAELMQHRAGLAKIHKPFTTTKQALVTFTDVKKLEQWVFTSLRMDTQVCGENESFYHAITRGVLLDLLVFKVDGRRLEEFIRNEICLKLGLQDCVSLGCATPQHFARMAQCETMNSMAWDVCRLGANKILRQAYFNSLGEDEYDYWYYQPREISSNLKLVTSSEMRKMFIVAKDKGVFLDKLANCRTFTQIPVSSMNFVASAYGLARINQELANGGGVLLSKRGMQLALCNDGERFDRPTQTPICFTNCGWSKDFFRKDWFGWSGAGGSLNMFSVKYNASFAYVPTKLESRMYCSNALRILDEFIKVLESRSNVLQVV